MAERLSAHLVAGGKYHDIDYARLELLKLLGEHEHLRVTVSSDYAPIETIRESSFLVTYTCDVRPSAEQQEALASWVTEGGRWLALHGTNAALDFTPTGVEAPKVIDSLAHTLGSQFIAHPPIHPFRVEVSDPSHPLVEGIEPFDTDDELYLSEYHDREKLQVLLETRFQGEAAGFAAVDWKDCDPVHLVMYLRELGEGAVLYNTLGHCRGHYDMRPVMDYYPQVERCSWEKPAYHEMLRRSIRWAMHEL